jgi:hypothetical protein
VDKRDHGEVLPYEQVELEAKFQPYEDKESMQDYAEMVRRVCEREGGLCRDGKESMPRWSVSVARGAQGGGAEGEGQWCWKGEGKGSGAGKGRAC